MGLAETRVELDLEEHRWLATVVRGFNSKMWTRGASQSISGYCVSHSDAYVSSSSA